MDSTGRRTFDPSALVSTAADLLTVRRVFGEAYEHDGVRVIPVAKVMGGHGLGYGGEGTGDKVDGTVDGTVDGAQGGGGEGGGGGWGVRVRPGRSGAPVVDAEGRVVGAVYARNSVNQSFFGPTSTRGSMVADTGSFVAAPSCAG